MEQSTHETSQVGTRLPRKSPSKIQAKFCPLTPIRKVRSHAEIYKAPSRPPNCCLADNNLPSEMVAAGALLIIGIRVVVFFQKHLHTRPSGSTIQ